MSLKESPFGVMNRRQYTTTYRRVAKAQVSILSCEVLPEPHWLRLQRRGVVRGYLYVAEHACLRSDYARAISTNIARVSPNVDI